VVTPTYVDTTAQAGASYEYRVQAAFYEATTPGSVLFSGPATSGTVSPLAAGGTILEQFNFAGQPGSESTATASTVAVGATASTLSRGSGFNPSTNGGTNGFSSIPMSTLTTYGTSATQAETRGQYDAFSITPTAGNSLTFSDLIYSFHVQNGIVVADNPNASPNLASAVEYSLNGTNFTLVTSQTDNRGLLNGNAPGRNGQDITATAELGGIAALQNATGTVYFHIDYYNANNDVTIGLGTDPGNTQDLIVDGSVAT
jgi:hypothetical protein